MTRVNLVPPSELDHKRLTGEYHEIPRLFNLVRKRIDKGQTPHDVRKEQPAEFKLGSGHQLFFYTRLGFIVKRIISLSNEMMSRGYKVDLDLRDRMLSDSNNIPREWFGDYEPTPEAIAISWERIAERMAAVPSK